MKNVLGSLLALLLALPLWAGADFEYELTLSRERAVVGEPVLLRLKVWQTDPSKILFFEFAPQASASYRLHLLEERSEETPQGTRATFRYLLFPTKAGRVRVAFRFVVKRTTEARLQHNNTGEPVKAKAIDTTDTPTPLPERFLRVDPLPEGTLLVGDYRLEATVDKRRTEAMAPVYLTIRLKGVGGEIPPSLPLLKTLPGVKVFADEPRIRRHYDDEGLHVEALYAYALVSDHDFTVPSLRLKAFSYRKGAPYTLTTGPIGVRVLAPEREKILDRQTRPPSLEEQVAALKQWGLYLLIFVSGYLTAMAAGRLQKAWRRPGGSSFARAVKEARDARALLTVLIREDPVRYASFIERLERAIYKGERIDLGRLKKEVRKYG